MTNWLSVKFREVISATDVKDLLRGPWKLKVAALGLAFLLWILVRLSTQVEGPVSLRDGSNIYAGKMSHSENNVVPEWFSE
ncbi:MAG: hypothetical protein CME30_02715 [Gemmatimonadetes bacterium]|nr:hypothetical protein [Gemmatimonadota bacterium]